MTTSTLTSTRLLLAMAALCIAAVGIALVSQHVFDMQPCPWCILQRLIYLAIAALCLIGAAVSAGLVRQGIGALTLLLAISGGASALYQELVASKSASCNLTFADKIISALGLDGAFPPLLQVTANCSDAAVSVLGVSYAYWSLALFVAMASASMRVVLRAR
ncbi:MAG: disulfide bond formation protein B [Burkholderiales bacterium PBB1]|nr:MAG: disulfide bond formation protein B [Burkholderiales bacterium PBB1]